MSYSWSNISILPFVQAPPLSWILSPFWLFQCLYTQILILKMLNNMPIWGRIWGQKGKPVRHLINLLVPLAMGKGFLWCYNIIWEPFSRILPSQVLGKNSDDSACCRNGGKNSKTIPLPLFLPIFILGKVKTTVPETRHHLYQNCAGALHNQGWWFKVVRCSERLEEMQDLNSGADISTWPDSLILQ